MASRDAEDSVYQAAKSGLQRFLGRARDAVMAPFKRFGTVPDPTAVYSAQPIWQAEVDRIMRALTPALQEGWAAAHLPGSYSPTDPYIQANLALTHNLLVRIPDEVHALVVRDILAGTNAGEDKETIAARVDNTLTYTGSENWDNRARVIAQTECLPGHVSLQSGVITAAYRRWYEGHMLTVITENGNWFTGTPNHPVLTQRGWVPLSLLSEQDYLVGDQRAIQQSSLPIDPDVKAGPATVGEVFDAIKAVGVVRRIRGGKPDFHGDGADGDIDVVLPDGLLLHGAIEPLGEEELHVLFEGASLKDPSLSSASTIKGGASGFPQDGIGALVAQLYAALLQQTSDGSPANPQVGRYYVGALSRSVTDRDLLAVQGAPNRGPGGSIGVGLGGRATSNASSLQGTVDSGGGATKLPGDGQGRGSSEVLLSKVVTIEVIEDWSGHVYNFTTLQGHYIAQGTYTKNCTRHHNSSTLAHALLVQQQDGGQYVKVWDTTMDDRERDAHKRANNQTRLIQDPFNVDNQPLLFPGDPLGSPENVINCRCSISVRKA